MLGCWHLPALRHTVVRKPSTNSKFRKRLDTNDPCCVHRLIHYGDPERNRVRGAGPFTGGATRLYFHGTSLLVRPLFPKSLVRTMCSNVHAKRLSFPEMTLGP